MDLTYYKPTALEELICKHYRKAGIQYPFNLEIEMIADLFLIDISYREGKTFIDCDDGFYFIVIDARLSPEERRKEFFHELGHFLLHYGNQNILPKLLKEFQEMQADHFQYYAAMPFYMLSEFSHVPHSLLVKIMAEEFLLPEDFVKFRLDQVKRRINIGQQDHQLNSHWSRSVKVTKNDVQALLDAFICSKKEMEFN
ncbi:ImmA/IrrE family metallo-endopeptidase [Paenibacillus sp. CGMCC 1.16610]|uniref:ImmA/IrrE family metallo-endopeptidase n=1 Tax=Paenibacillus anseongense TaxID=2682845 RepID=A0ABW9U0Z3_9BACL|nr:MULTISPECIES: ImmA/IrrE family metallo-endopeptidase [Paenibacillus]MBA2943181.1 ImmA/IrrE family metallo-endopeptidase [Paenibacillus sp. CGMCC 1.16610]MVQ33678.1 ImmA/IrrE family metallo-endopeptidase [Paenibacillus anseongense]